MASSSNPAQTHSLNTPSTQYQSQAESEIYNLDDPFLVRKVLNQHPKVAGSITCRFLAIPLNAPQASSYDIAQHGHVSHESKDKLIMRVPSHNLHLLGVIRQVWVSKYMAPYTECMITFDLPRQDHEQTSLVIVQRVLPKTAKGANELLVDNSRRTSTTTISEPSVADGGQASLLSAGASGAERCGPRQRRRAKSFP